MAISHLPALAITLGAYVAQHLGINEAAALGRVGRLATQFAHTHETDLETACARLAALGGRDLVCLLAEGPHEQTLALLEPVEIHPGTHGGIGGGVEVTGDREQGTVAGEEAVAAAQPPTEAAEHQGL